MAGALIVSVEFAAEDFAWLEGLRRRYYPPERNRVPVHLTMFHALPPSIQSEVHSRLSDAARQARPKATIAGLMDLGGGVAFRVVSDDLDRIRRELATALHGALTAQDSGGWRPHITIQNKVSPKVARALLEALKRDFRPRPLGIRGLGLHRYLDGPWENLASYSCRN